VLSESVACSARAAARGRPHLGQIFFEAVVFRQPITARKAALLLALVLCGKSPVFVARRMNSKS